MLNTFYVLYKKDENLYVAVDDEGCYFLTDLENAYKFDRPADADFDLHGNTSIWHNASVCKEYLTWIPRLSVKKVETKYTVTDYQHKAAEK